MSPSGESPVPGSAAGAVSPVAARPTAILAWHGTRNADGRRDTARITDLLREEIGGEAAVVSAYVDEKVQGPGLAAVIERELSRTSAEVVVLPAFLAAGYHVRHDVGAAAQEATAGDRGRLNRVLVAPHLGQTARGATEPGLVEAVLAALAATDVEGDRGEPSTGVESASGGPIVLASAGSAWEAVAVEIERLRLALAGRLPGRAIRHAVLDGTFAVGEGETCVPLLLARGFFADRARAAGGAQAPLLGDAPAVAHIVAALADRTRVMLDREQN